MKIFHFINNIAFGVLIGFYIGIGFVLFLGTDVSTHVSKNGIYALTVSATLIASTLALAGVKANIDKQQELSDQKTKRSLAAARAVLPLTLSGIRKKAEVGFKIKLDAVQNRKLETHEKLALFETIRISDDDLERISKCIEHSDESVGGWLEVILAHWQIESSRLHSDLFCEDFEPEIERCQIHSADWLMIVAMIDQLFDFSRVGKAPNEVLENSRFRIPLLSEHLYSPVGANINKGIKQNINFYSDDEVLTLKNFKDKLHSSAL